MKKFCPECEREVAVERGKCITCGFKFEERE